uniref:LacI family DNA-binding transcriptional regulator n=1 Tax=Alistipes shahii TaxID=328814 RepID=UPI002FDD2491
MGASLKDIACKLNLSKTTVSWVLSGQGDKKGISAETQSRVLACARSLAYEPNLLARSLNTGVSKTIGLILPSISDTFFAHIADWIESEAEREGYSLMIAGSNSETERENALIRLFRSKKVDGIIIAPADASGCEVGRLAESGCPVVLFDRCLAKTDAGCVVIDNEAGSHALVRHLAARGFRKIAIITTFPHLPTMELRHRGYRQHVCDTLDRILAMVPDTDGFFFTTHILATEALRYFHDRGIDISDGRLGLACMHEDPLFRLAAPRMSVARFPVEEISAHAVRLLLRQIRESQSPGSVRPAPESVVLPCRMEFRDE